jgi:hypothetical protein
MTFNYSIGRANMKLLKRILALTTLGILFAMFGCATVQKGGEEKAAPPAKKIKIQYPFAISSRFPDNLQHIGVPKGNVFQVGAFITPCGFPITEVTAKNLDTGLILKPTSSKIGTIFAGLYEVKPQPPFDPSKHLGVWEIRVKDEKGNESVAKTHKLDKVAEMPYVKDVKASGSPLAPTITWVAPNEKDIPEGCRVLYRVRLLKDFNNQYYLASNITDTKHRIRKGKIKSEDLSDTYIRIECQCWDTDGKGFPLELISHTFRPLKEALGK